MPVSHPGGRRREKLNPTQRRDLPLALNNSHLVSNAPTPHSVKTAAFSVVDLGKSSRISVMLTPEARGEFKDQARETLSAMVALLEKTPGIEVTSQTVFLRDPASQKQCEQILAAHYGDKPPLTNFVLQPPCSGAALALEAWAIGGSDVQIQRFGPHALAVSYDGLRWVHCAGISIDGRQKSAYLQTLAALKQMQSALIEAGSDFGQVVRTWFCLGNITESENGKQRYMELNRARTDFYNEVRFSCSLPVPNIPQGIYPASTGIGMAGRDLNASCLSLQTKRKDAFLLPLENPLQTPAYAYPPKYSEKSPKFSRAKAFVQGSYVTTWISGTASVIHSESHFSGDFEQQTQQTIDNIQRLIAPENFAFHGVKGAGATLRDLAKIRVYLRRPEDFVTCKAICEERFGSVPAIYAVAEICRPELLVEIEGVAFSRHRSADI